jgi:hypothetical protein
MLLKIKILYITICILIITLVINIIRFNNFKSYDVSNKNPEIELDCISLSNQYFENYYGFSDTIFLFNYNPILVKGINNYQDSIIYEIKIYVENNELDYFIDDLNKKENFKGISRLSYDNIKYESPAFYLTLEFINNK